jgi:hypothetical protein
MKQIEGDLRGVPLSESNKTQETPVQRSIRRLTERLASLVPAMYYEQVMSETEALQPVTIRETTQPEREITPTERFGAQLFVATTERLKKEWFDLTANIEKFKSNLEEYTKKAWIIKNFSHATVAALIFTSSVDHQDMYNAVFAPNNDQNRGALSSTDTNHQETSTEDHSWITPRYLPERNHSVRANKFSAQKDTGVGEAETQKEEENKESYRLDAPQMVHDDVLKAIVEYYRDDLPLERRRAYADAFINAKNKYTVNPELLIAAIYVPEGSFGRNRGSLSAKFNFINEILVGTKTTKHRSFPTLQAGMDRGFSLMTTYLNGELEYHPKPLETLDEALPIFCSSWKTRLPLAKRFTSDLRELSGEYEKGTVPKGKLPEKIDQMINKLKEEFPKNTRWIQK